MTPLTKTWYMCVYIYIYIKYIYIYILIYTDEDIYIYIHIYIYNIYMYIYIYIHWWEQNIFCSFTTPQAFWQSSAPGALSTLVTSIVLYSLTQATMMSPGKNETRVYIYIYIYILFHLKIKNLELFVNYYN